MKKIKDTKEYSIEEAVKKVKSDSRAKFDASVELHINLDLDPSKQSIRFPVNLPHGTGKTKKVAVLSSGKIKEADMLLNEEDLPKIEKGDIKPGVDFDILITEPRFMPVLAKYAKILGPAGVMPNPKNGTVSEDVLKAIEQFKKGKVDIKTEKLAPLIHTIIGKVSFEEKALTENFNEVLTNLKQNKPAKASPIWIKSIFLTSSMGPSVKVNPSL
ncbi:50S ribosomal protein L1 [Patescibacteria group bacterium]|nr:50S ribosomal protein L1 [Patescibacteria group bacterium]